MERQKQLDFFSDESQIWNSLDASRQQLITSYLANLWMQYAITNCSVNEKNETRPSNESSNQEQS